MQKLNPKKAAENPLSAALLGAVLLKASRESGDPYQEEAGQKQIQIAQDNHDKMPTINPECELALAVKRARKLE